MFTKIFKLIAQHNNHINQKAKLYNQNIFTNTSKLIRSILLKFLVYFITSLSI